MTNNSHELKTTPTWREIHEMIHEICKGIEIEDVDLLIGLSVGGLVPTALFSVELEHKAVATISARSYVGKKQQELIVSNVPKKEDIEGKHILLIDDIVDTGKTIREIKKMLLEKYGARKVSVAAVYVKKDSPQYPDYWHVETTEWIEFPWDEKIETPVS